MPWLWPTPRRNLPTARLVQALRFVLAALLISPASAPRLFATGPALDAGWHIQSPLPYFPTGLTDIHYANGKYVAVGSSGRLIHSDDGLLWTPVNSGMNAGIRCVIWGSSGWRALTSTSALESTDGVTWTPAATAPPSNANDLAYGGGIYVALNNTQVFTSTNGRDWDLKATLQTSSGSRKIVWGDDGFVIVGGDNGTARSPDGINWTEAAQNVFGSNTSLAGLAYGGGTYVTLIDRITNLNSNTHVRELWVSANGQNWSQMATPDIQPTSVQYSSSLGFFVTYNTGSTFNRNLTSASGALKSSDGLSWVQTPPAYLEAFDVYASSQIISYAVSAPDRWLLGSSTNRFVSSTDGTNWTSSNSSGVDTGLTSIAYGSGRFVAVNGKGAIFTSPDGEQWTRRKFLSDGGTAPVSKVAYGNGIFVGVGDKNRVYRSVDGVTWTSSFYGGVANYTSTVLSDIVYANGLFMVYAGGTGFSFSSDGISWLDNGVSPVFDSYNKPMLGTWPGGFVAMPWRSNTIFRLPTAQYWAASTSSEQYGFADMLSVGSRWVAVGSNASGDSTRIKFSDDLGETWQTPANIAAHSSLMAVAHGGGETVAVGSSGEILSSTDFQNWETQRLYADNFSDVVYASGTFVAIGSGGFGGADGLILTKRKEPAAKGFSWRSAALTISEGAGLVTATIDREGDAQEAVSLTVRTLDGSARQGEDYQSSLITVPFAAGETSRTIQIPLVDDTLVEWPTLITGNFPAESPLRRTEYFTIYLAEIPDGYAILGKEDCTMSIMDDDEVTRASWDPAYFTLAEMLDPLIGGDDADPDSDGLPNLYEYALGLHPRSSVQTAGRLPWAAITPFPGVNLGGPISYKAFSFLFDRSRSDILYVPQYSLDLGGWSDIVVLDPVVLSVPINNPWQMTWVQGNIYQVDARAPEQDTPRLFYRLDIRRR